MGMCMRTDVGMCRCLGGMGVGMRMSMIMGVGR